MTIAYKTDDMFLSGAEALVNPVNCMGVMGAGLAGEFKARFPDYYADYKTHCTGHDDRIWVGAVTPYKVNEDDTIRAGLDGKKCIPKWIISFPTKTDLRLVSKIEWIVGGLNSLVFCIRDLGITSIAIPALGCGLGRLKWDEVQPLIHERLEPLTDVQIYVYEPKDKKWKK